MNILKILNITWSERLGIANYLKVDIERLLSQRSALRTF